MLSFSRQIDINYFQGDPSRLGHHQGPRKPHYVDYQDIALEVPGGDLVDLDLLDNSLYRIVLKN